MWSFALRNPVNAHRIFSSKLRQQTAPTGKEEVLVTASFPQAFSTFQAIAPTAQGTTTIATPRKGGSIAITDILMAVRKKNTAVVTLQFTDGSDTEILFSADVTNGELYFSHSVVGRFQGWEDARLDFVIATADVDANVTIGYLLSPEGLPFTDWDNLR